MKKSLTKRGCIIIYFFITSLFIFLSTDFVYSQLVDERAIIQSQNKFNFSSQVDLDNMSGMINQNVTLGELLQGQVANVQVSASDGSPGAAVDINIRGGSSIVGDFQPLYVLDGVILSSSNLDVANPWSTEDKGDYQNIQNMLWNIKVSDIASIDVLKNTSATAIYGSRGANGVIVIKTKTGSKLNKEISWSSNAGISTLMQKQKLLSGPDYKNYYQQLIGNSFVENGIEKDWQNEIFVPAFSNNHNLSIAGMLRRTNYYISFNTNQNFGIVLGTNSTDYALRTNLEQIISPFVKIGARFLISQNGTNMTQSTTLIGSNSLTTSVYAVPFEAEGENPLNWRDDYRDQSSTWRIIPQGYFNFTISPWLTAKILGGIDYIEKTRFRWMGNQIEKGALENGRAGHSWLQSKRYNISTNLIYDRTFENHRVKFEMGGELMANNEIKLSNYASDFAIQVLKAKAINFASFASNPIYTKINSSTYAGYGVINYYFQDLVEFQFGSRGDHLIDFDKSMQAYPFVNSRVNLLKEKTGNITSFSLHGGWGISGKNELYPYLELNNITLNDPSLFIPFEQALSFVGRIDSKTNQFNVGFDVGFVDNRLKLSAQLYAGNTTDKIDIHDFRTPEVIETVDDFGIINSTLKPYDKIYWRKNLELQKWGIEVTFSAIPIKTNSLSWNITSNFGLNRIKMLNTGLPDTSPDLGYTHGRGFVGRSVSGLSNVGATAFIQGYTPGVFYGYKTQGVITDDHVLLTPPFEGLRLSVGDPKYIDLNNDGTVDANDKVVIGNPNPDLIFGINNILNYNKLFIQMRIDGVVGNDVLNLNKLISENVSTLQNVSFEAYREAYSTVSEMGTKPKIGAEVLDQISDRMIEDGSFIRLSNITVGYKIPLNNEILESLRELNVNLMISNAFVLSKYSGYNPDVNSYAGDWSRRGIDMGAFPSARTFSFGFTAKF